MSGRGNPSAYNGFQGASPRHPRGAMHRTSPSNGTSPPFTSPQSFLKPPSPNDSDPPMAEGETHPPLVQPRMPHGTAGTKIELVSNFYKMHVKEMIIYHYYIDLEKVQNPKRLMETAHNEPNKTMSTCAGGEQTGPTSSLGGDRTFQNCLTGETSAGMSNFRQPASPTTSEEKRLEGRIRFTKRFAGEIVEQFAKECSEMFADARFAFDGYRSLYTSRKLNAESPVVRLVSLNIDCRPATFRVTMKFTDSYNMDEVLRYYRGEVTTLSEQSVSIYDAVLRAIIGTNYTHFQRKFYDLDTVARGRTVCDFVQGFFASVVPTEIGLTLNVHNKTAAIIDKDRNRLLDLVNAIQPAVRDGNRVQRAQLLEVNKFLRHVKFSTMHGNRELRYTIDAIVERNPYEVNFLQKERLTSIAEYFRAEYGIVCLELPLIKTLGTHFHYIPLELAILQGTTFLANSKLNSAVQKELLTRSTLKPNVYFARTTEIAKRVANADRAMQAAFNLSLNTAPINLTGRVLKSPQVLNADKRMPFYQPGTPPPSWCIFALSNTEINAGHLGFFADSLVSRAQAFGLNMPMPHPIALIDIGDRIENIYNVIQNIKMRINSDFVFIGIPKYHPQLQGQALYNYIKLLCDKTFTLPNQCFKLENAHTLPPGYFDQFLLKTNAKLGGRNAVIAPEDLRVLPFDTESTMVIGFDISHPATGDQVISSVAAAVGSLDEMWSQYTASVRVQRRGREEMIEALDEMIYELLGEWFATHDQTLPDRLIIYRDGVSDGEIDLVRAREVPLIQKAINRTSKPMPFLLILTNKTHNVRFARRTLSTNGNRPTYNVPSGTVVDSTIINPKESVFFLNSHFSPLGTSKPMKYTIIRNELNLNADQIQQMVFFSCFNSARTRSVINQPTAVRYADLLAYRSKALIEARLTTHMEIEAAFTNQTAFEDDFIGVLNKSVKVDEDMRRKLYYC